MKNVIYVDMPERIIAVEYEADDVCYLIINSMYKSVKSITDKIENLN